MAYTQRDSKFMLIAFIFFFAAYTLWDGFYLSRDINIPIEEPFDNISFVRMTRRDANSLEYFFREIIIPDSLAYTLAGSKPLSFTCYREPGSSLQSFTPPNLKIAHGWKIWEKYSDKFQINRLKFWKEKSPWVNGVNCLILADVVLCQKSVEQNTVEFETILGEEAQDLFKDLGRTPFFSNTLKMHEGLIGILLGFGKANAWLYYQNTKDSNFFSKLPRVWNSITEEEASNYAWKYCTLRSLNISDLMLPVFVGDPDSEESQQLKQKYLSTREKIEAFYSGKSFLSATLSLYKNGTSLLGID